MWAWVLLPYKFASVPVVVDISPPLGASHWDAIFSPSQWYQWYVNRILSATLLKWRLATDRAKVSTVPNRAIF